MFVEEEKITVDVGGYLNSDDIEKKLIKERTQ